ncbi:MAG TPA: sigma-70 family RNA polymerase sigma factor [Polyangiaceae bacterium]|nr:sigma-70 family RNA polymerase sigma factor [Polyangiaceae bacterium]
MFPAIVATESPREVDVGEERRRAHVAARARWPGIEVTLEQFVAHLESLGWVRELPKQTDELYLCCACHLDIREACRRLDAEYTPALEASLARQCRRRDFIDEILQQMRERLFVGPERKIASYRGDGPLSAWLRRVTWHLALDLYRKEKQERRFVAASAREAVASANARAAGDSRASHPSDDRHLGQLERAILASMAQLSGEDRRLLHSHYVLGLSVDEIALCLHRDRSNIYRRLSQIRDRIKRWSMASARKETGLRDRDELDGLFQANCMGIYLDPIVWLDAAGACGPSTTPASASPNPATPRGSRSPSRRP